MSLTCASWFEINVAKDGRHFFATAKRSITNKWDLEKVFPVIKARFPESEGFSVSVTAHVEYGRYYERPQTFEEIMEREEKAR